MFVPALAATAMLAAAPATAQFFKCQDADGKVVFSDTRCEGPAVVKAERADTSGRHQLTEGEKARIRELEALLKKAGVPAEVQSAAILEISSIRSGQEARLTLEQRARREAVQAGLSGTDVNRRKEALNTIREIYSQ